MYVCKLTEIFNKLKTVQILEETQRKLTIGKKEKKGKDYKDVASKLKGSHKCISILPSLSKFRKNFPSFKW